MRYFIDRFKKVNDIEGEITKDSLPKINIFKIPQMIHNLLVFINRIPIYYKMYPGRDKSVPYKKVF